MIVVSEKTRQLFAPLGEAVGGSCVFDRSGELLPSVEVRPDRIVEAVRFLRDSEFDGTVLDSITATDLSRFPTEPDAPFPPWAAGGEEGADHRRFLVVYQIGCRARNELFILKCFLPGTDPVIDSIDSLYGNANWHEREAFDLLGIRFANSKDLRRILLPDDWIGFPLRKDYVEEESYAGMSTTIPIELHARQKEGEALVERLLAEQDKGNQIYGWSKYEP